MRILIHALNFAPELVGCGKATGDMAEWLAERGHDVRIVTAPPFNPEWKVAPGFSPWRYARSIVETKAGRLTVFRCPVWVPSQPSAARRILHLASFALASFPVLLRQTGWKPEVVMVTEPTLFCVPGALLTGRFCGAKTWLHVLDFEADVGFEMGILKSAGLKRAVSWGERLLMSAFDRVSTISGKMLSRLEQKGVAPSACTLLPNWADTDIIFPLDRPSLLRAELGIPPGAVIALYSGTMGRKQGLEILAEAASRLASHERLRFVFCGEGPGKADLAFFTRGMPNVQWIPLQSFERLNDLLNLADIHLLPQRADAADLVMPSKLTGMLASGRPVVATSRPDTQLAQLINGRGIVVGPGNVTAFADSVAALADNPRLRQELGKNARAYACSDLKKQTVLSRFEQELCFCASVRDESGHGRKSSLSRASDSRMGDAVPGVVIRSAPVSTVGHSAAEDSSVVFSPYWESASRRALKRMLDILGAAAILLLLFPLYLLLAIAVRLDSPGNALYRWRVVGQRGRPFVSYKFRSMVANADDLRAGLEESNEMIGPVFKMSRDPRVTRVGKWMRRYSLDELPQIYSVLKGDMSLVGPRPPMVREYQRFTDLQKRKLAVKPGMTGLWQVSGRNRVNDLDAWVRLDLEYIRRWSLWQDTKILLRTVVVVLSGSGR